jgi:folate-dependent phosphoribosylglycinamide formyltransferase PurN
VPVRDDDTAAALHERIQQVEHELYSSAIAAWLRGELVVQARRVLRRKSS